MVFPVTAKWVKPGVSAVKYRYLLSSFNSFMGSSDHFLSLYLLRVIEFRSMFLSSSQDFSTLKHTTGFSIFFSVTNPAFPTQRLKYL